MKSSLPLALLLCLALPLRAADLVQDLRFVEVPAGRFVMGSERGGYKDERPVQQLNINAFLMMDHELTIGEAKRLMKAHPGLLGRAPGSPLPEDPRRRPANADDLPAVLTLAEAQAVVAKLSDVSGRRVRLPTEPEWEYAARGGLQRKLYPWGSPGEKFRGTPVDALVRTTRGEDCDPMTSVPVAPVRTATPGNGYGLFDMAGNAWEWTASTYRRYPHTAQSVAGLQRKDDEMIVIRGGGQAPEACDVRVALRGYAYPDSRHGLRLVMEK